MRLAWLTDTADLVVRWTVAVALAEVVHAHGGKLSEAVADAIAEHVERPTLGRWLGGLRALGAAAPARPLLTVCWSACSAWTASRAPAAAAPSRSAAWCSTRRPRAASSTGSAMRPARLGSTPRATTGRRDDAGPGRSRARGAEKARFRAPATG